MVNVTSSVDVSETVVYLAERPHADAQPNTLGTVSNYRPTAKFHQAVVRSFQESEWMMFPSLNVQVIFS